MQVLKVTVDDFCAVECRRFSDNRILFVLWYPTEPMYDDTRIGPAEERFELKENPVSLLSWTSLSDVKFEMLAPTESKKLAKEWEREQDTLED